MNCALPHSVEDLYAGAPLSAARHPPLHLRRHLILPCRLSSHEMELAHELSYEYKLNRITILKRTNTNNLEGHMYNISVFIPPIYCVH